MNTTSPVSLWEEAWSAIRTNFVPGLVLWVMAAGIVLVYYFVAEARPLYAMISQWKAQGGFGYSIASTALFAGLIPFVFLRIMPATRGSATLGTLIFTTLFWAYRGFEIDLLYRFQAVMFGSDPTWTTVAAKVAFDLFVYNVFWAASLQLLTYHWKNTGFRFDALTQFPWAAYFRRTLPAAILSTWAVWLPVLIFVYSLPGDLQIPLFNLAACFWALVMASLTSKPRSATGTR